jgi:serine/threonine protein kinase/predicted ATPase
MTPERWQRIEQIYRSAIARKASDRAAFLEKACNGDSELKQRVEALLEANARAGGFSTSVGNGSEKRAAPVQSTRAGHLINHYRILSPLGTGGMGEVWMAEDTRLGRRVAIKLLPPRFIADKVRLRRFEDEARAASALNHPNIVTIHELGEAESTRYIVMELVGGCTLRDLINQSLTPDALAGLGAQIGRALHLAHIAGIIHRDVKPENIMVRDDGLIKVLDFGVARLNSNLDEAKPNTAERPAAGAVLGTLHYMSPEQARGDAVTGATDVFSLGVVLYELSTGRHPFESSNRPGNAGLLQAILFDDPQPPAGLNPTIPFSFETLILQMLSKDPRQRPTAEEVENALESLSASRRRVATATQGLVETSALSPRSTAGASRRRPMVGRDRERTELFEGFESVNAGRGLIMGVAGEPGIGKTTIVEEFLHEIAIDGRPCRVARGRCSERLAGAEAYLPWLEALEALTRGSETVSHALKRFAPSWRAQLAPPGEFPTGGERQTPDALSASQERMKREMVAFLAEISRLQPLVVYIDDLHWADVSTIDLLGFLAARFDVVRTLVIVTYRPSDMMLSKHPFLQIKPDLQTRGLCRELSLEFLTQVEIENYLELEFPLHRFPPEFPKLIFAKTEGNPLFMADLVRYLRDRQVIYHEEEQWRLARSVPEIERELPESVRGMIERKIAQLSEEDRQLLISASVQGAQFDSAVVARVLDRDAAEIEERLETLERVFAFIQLIGERELPDRSLTLRYRFVHVFYQNTLYASLRPTRKVQLSRAVADALLQCYGDRNRETASELAALYEAARDSIQAARCYRLAAENAVHVFASREAVALAHRGLDALKALPETREKQETEFALQITLGNLLIASRGYASADVATAYSAARRLCQTLGDTANLPPVLYGLYVNHMARADYKSALNFGEEFLSLAETRRDPAVVVGYRAVGVPLFFMGKLAEARQKFDQGLKVYTAADHRSLTWVYGGEPAMVCHNYLAWTTWLLGYPDRAINHSREAIRLSREVAHAQSQAQAFAGAGLLHQYLGDPRLVREMAEAAIALASEQGLALWLGWGTILRGWAMVQQGETTAGLDRIRRGIEGTRVTGAGMWLTYLLCLLAEAYGTVGRPDEGLALLEEVPPLIESNEERYWEAEMHRLHGELLKAQGAPPAECERHFALALEIAKRQGARSLELRAAMSLARSFLQQGNRRLAHQILAPTYDWFTEGFGTHALREARGLLDEAGS